MKPIAVMLIIACCAASAGAAEKGLVIDGSKRSITLPAPTVTLKKGKGMELTRSYCAICHSLDYITTQQKFPKARWQAEVAKMVKVYGAPINEENARIIVDYITTAYGKGDRS
ncbi:MAG: cytochrome c [Geobacter sp.]|nr:cytochrome c [Geobacter sp.]